MSDPAPSDEHPAQEKHSQPVSPQPAGPSAESGGPDFMGKIKIVGGFVAAIAALLTALNGAEWLKPTPPTPSPGAETVTPVPATPVPTVVATAASPASSPSPHTQVSEGTLLVEDFGDPSGGWETEASQECDLEYLEGEYRIAVHVPDLSVWGGPPDTYEFADFSFEADARYVSGPDDGDFGLVARSRGDSDFYLFAVNSRLSAYSVQTCQDGSWAELAEWTDSEAVHPGMQTNHLRVECLGSGMRFYVNGQLLAEVVDSTFTSGSIGLLAETFEEGGLEVRFDNVRVQVLKGF